MRSQDAFLFGWNDVQAQLVNRREHSYQVLPPAKGRRKRALTTESAVSYKPVAFTSGGAPVYDLSKDKVACPQTQAPTSTGGGQVLATEEDDPHNWSEAIRVPIASRCRAWNSQMVLS
jgi:hypothetical protein